jgi:hypothetical protein
MTDGFAFSERQMTVNDSSSMFSDKRSLHERLSEHLETCSECQAATQSKTKPKGLGQRMQLCSRYQDIIAVWAEQEGRVNNIVDHDEYGNRGSDTYYENGGSV